MILDQRRHNILQTIETQGFVSLQSLVELVGASESTIRRDLEYLDRIGQIRRTRGGASFTGESLQGFDERRSQATAEKQAVARVAAGLVQSGEAVMLDGGTTTLEVARQLIGRALHVVTNSLPIVNLLANQPEIELIQIGGYLFPKTGVALGPLAVSALSQIHVRRLFMSVGGITEQGLFNTNTLLVETERQMMLAAEEVVVVTDSSKLGHSALAHLCPLQKVHQLVVDKGITDEWQRILEDAGVKVLVAS
ncbi:MAG: DeoR/GlpR family DNA-binding transcription regulator [Planctomycetota bacterium]|jgi:DeoR family fructose operon transcriptional repressor